MLQRAYRRSYPHPHSIRSGLIDATEGKAFRRGAAAVEFAVVSTMAFVFIFAAFEFCRVAVMRHGIDNAVYEGARHAALPGATAADARQATRQVLHAVGIQHAAIEVTPTNINRQTREVTVNVAVPLDANSLVPSTFFRGKTLRRSLTMAREGIR